MAGTLYIVATPIGNLEDMPPRVAATFGAADFIAAEDTRVTMKLLNYLGLKKPMVSYYEHALQKGEAILQRIEAGESCALCSDAGMPCVSDPGEVIVRDALARYFQSIGVGNGWEMAFIVIGGLGFIWMGLWMFLYKKPNVNPRVNAAELEYIEQDNNNPEESKAQQAAANDFDNKKISFLQCFKFPQTWAVFVGKFMTDGVWWFFLFWTPAYISDVYGFASDTGTAQMLIFVLYAITMLSIYGGKLPTIIINKTGKNPYAARMQAMLIFALFPLLALFAQPLGNYSYWYPIIIIGIAGAAHQSWSANIYSVVGDMFPKSTIATIVGIGGMAGGIGSFCINMGSGRLFDYAAETNMTFMGFEGKPAGYFIIFCVCAVAYLVGWIIMKALVPKYKPVDA